MNTIDDVLYHLWWQNDLKVGRSPDDFYKNPTINRKYLAMKLDGLGEDEIHKSVINYYIKYLKRKKHKGKQNPR